jgi:transcriptional regulator with XRE-family HTH domain
MVEQRIPVARLRPIVERWLTEYETPEDAFHGLATNGGLKADSWRKRFSATGWWARDTVDPVDVDAFLTAADLTHVWYEDLADLLPELPPLEDAPQRKRRKRTVPKKIGERDLRQMHLLHERRYVSARQIAVSLHERYGYPNEKHMSSEICRGWKVLGLRAHDRIEMTVRASTKDGLSPRDWQTRKARRLAAGLTQKAKVRQAICTRCSRPSMHESEFCYSHDPAGEQARLEAMAAMRARSPLMLRDDLEDAAPVTALLTVYRQSGGSWRSLARAAGVPEAWLSHVAHGKQARVDVARANRLRAALNPPLEAAA